MCSEVDERGCPKVEPEKIPELLKEVRKPEANKLNRPFYYYDSSHETEIRTGIWTDGNQYIVQISSWKTSRKANSREITGRRQEIMLLFKKHWFKNLKEHIRELGLDI